MSCGIYKITNNINNNSYIGQSINIENRWIHHKNYPKENGHYPLYLAFEKYGIENFSFEIIEECKPEELNEKEIYWIKYYNTFNQGYNQTEGGQGAANLNIKLSNEDVNEIYNLLKNTTISQKEIALRYKVGEDTISEINNGKTRINSEIEYPIRKNKLDQKFCSKCGKPIYKTATYCSDCYAFLQRTVERPNREELKQLIRTLSFTKIGEKYGVTDNSIRKWCDAENLPRRKKDIKTYSDKEWELI